MSEPQKRLAISNTAQKKGTIDPFEFVRTLKHATASEGGKADWFAPYENRVIRLFSHAGLHDRNRIDDIRNQVAVSFALSLIKGRYNPHKGDPQGYLSGLTFYTCLTELRRIRRSKMSRFDHSEVQDRDAGPHAQAAISEIQQIVRSAITELPPRYRDTLRTEYGIPDESGRVPAPLEPRNDLVLFRAKRRLREVLNSRYQDTTVLF